MKKWPQVFLSSTLIILLLFSFVGCGSSKEMTEEQFRNALTESAFAQFDRETVSGDDLNAFFEPIATELGFEANTRFANTGIEAELYDEPYISHVFVATDRIDISFSLADYYANEYYLSHIEKSANINEKSGTLYWVHYVVDEEIIEAGGEPEGIIMVIQYGSGYYAVSQMDFHFYPDDPALQDELLSFLGQLGLLGYDKSIIDGLKKVKFA